MSRRVSGCLLAPGLAAASAALTVACLLARPTFAAAEVQPPLAGEQEAPVSPKVDKPDKPAADISALLEPPPGLADKNSAATGAGPLANEGVPCQTDPAELQVLLALRTRRLELDGRERAVVAREAGFKASQKKLDERIEQLNQVVLRLEARLELGEPGRQAHEKRLHGLVESLSNLSAKKAAPILAATDPVLVADLLQRLGTARTAALLAVMPTVKAARVVDIAGGARQPGVRPGPSASDAGADAPATKAPGATTPTPPGAPPEAPPGAKP